MNSSTQNALYRRFDMNRVQLRPGPQSASEAIGCAVGTSTGSLYGFHATQYFRLINLAPLVTQVDGMERGGNEREPDLLIRMPLKNRSPKPKPAIETFSTGVERPTQIAPRRFFVAESIEATLREVRGCEDDLPFEGIGMQRLPGFSAEVVLLLRNRNYAL